MTRAKPNMLLVAIVVTLVSLALWTALIYVCHTLVTGAAVVLDIISRSLN